MNLKFIKCSRHRLRKRFFLQEYTRYTPRLCFLADVYVFLNLYSRRRLLYPTYVQKISVILIRKDYTALYVCMNTYVCQGLKELKLLNFLTKCPIIGCSLSYVIQFAPLFSFKTIKKNLISFLYVLTLFSIPFLVNPYATFLCCTVLC